jgi:hypothetical protein
MIRRLFVVSLMVGCSLLLVRQTLQAQEKPETQAPNLSGVWKLNHDLSDPPHSGMPAEAGGEQGERGGRGGHPSGGMGGGRGEGMGGRDMAGGSRPSEEQMKKMRDLMREVMEAPETLTLTVSEGRITFVDPDGPVRHYATDGTGERHQMNAGVVETKTAWKNSELVIETNLGEGTKAVQTYALAPDKRQIVVTTRVENSRSPRQMPPRRSVYDSAIEKQ